MMTSDEEKRKRGLENNILKYFQKFIKSIMIIK